MHNAYYCEQYTLLGRTTEPVELKPASLWKRQKVETTEHAMEAEKRLKVSTLAKRK